MTLHTQKKIKFNLIPIAFLLLFGFSIQAQDKKAKDLLGEVTSKVKSYENITIDFKYLTINGSLNRIDSLRLKERLLHYLYCAFTCTDPDLD